MDIPMPYPISPLARIFPPLNPEEFFELAESIREHGLLHPILLWREEVVDGRHRLLACIQTGVMPRFEELPYTVDPLPRVLAANGARRHLDESQRAVVAYKAAQLAPAGEAQVQKDCANLRTITQDGLSKSLRVSRRLVTYAGKVLSENSRASPATRQAVEEGIARVSDAARVVELPPEIQDRAVELLRDRKAQNLSGAAKLAQAEAPQQEDAAASVSPLARPLDETTTLHVATIDELRALVEPSSVDAVITHPPHTKDALPQYADLAAFAAHALSDTGVLLVVGSGMLLPGMLERLNHPDLEWLVECDTLFNGPANLSGMPHFIQLHRRPVLVYRKRAFRATGYSDFIEVPAEDGLPPCYNRHEFAMRLLVEIFAKQGQLVCDPWMLDRSGTALGSMRSRCRFIGASERQESMNRIIQRLEREEQILSAEATTPSGDEGATDVTAPPENTGD